MPHRFNPIRYHVVYLAICLLLSYSPLGFAEIENLTAGQKESRTEKQTIAQLTQLIKNKQYPEAFALADKHIMAYGGEPSFDFLTGLAALQVGQYQQAVFAFERTIIVKPQWKKARFNLAKAYYTIDNFVAANTELQRLLKEVKDNKFQQAINRLILRVDKAQLTQQQEFKQAIGISLGHDSNINSGSTIDSFNSPLLSQPIVLNADGKAIADQRVNLNYQMRYRHPLSQKRSLVGDASLYYTDYYDDENDQFETTVANLAGHYQDQWLDTTMQLGVYFRPLWLDGHAYRDQYGVSADFTLPLNQQWQLGWQLGLGSTDYNDIDSLDASDTTVSISGQYRSGMWQHQLSANITDVDAKNNDSQHNTYRMKTLEFQSSYIISPSQQLTFALQWQDYDYDVIHPFFLKFREDELIRTSLGWRYRQNDQLVWQVNYQYHKKRSNLPIYRYQRNEVSVGAVMQF